MPSVFALLWVLVTSVVAVSADGAAAPQSHLPPPTRRASEAAARAAASKVVASAATLVPSAQHRSAAAKVVQGLRSTSKKAARGMRAGRGNVVLAAEGGVIDEECPLGCSGHGECKPVIKGRDERECKCAQGWTGAGCQADTCVDHCNGHGNCVHGKCFCFRGYEGPTCAMSLCPSGIGGAKECSGHGSCAAGQCFCDVAWKGEACDKDTCEGCSGHGTCVDGVCQCDKGFRGVRCNETTCPNDCSGHGTCDLGQCTCAEGWQKSDDCSIVPCPLECHRFLGHGECNNETHLCACAEGFGGLACERQLCPNDCHNNGACIGGRCRCVGAYTGPDCGTPRPCPGSPVECSGHGYCNEGAAACVCHAGWEGHDCADEVTDRYCGGHGRAFRDGCRCDIGWRGRNCTIDTCPNRCNRRGVCLSGKCSCAAGWTGEDCGVITCPNNCSGHGTCRLGACVCDTGWTGNGCHLRGCPNHCSHHGVCGADGKCRCVPAYAGDDCSEPTCYHLHDCHGRGQCVNGRCLCESNFAGLDCAVSLDGTAPPAPGGAAGAAAAAAAAAAAPDTCLVGSGAGAGGGGGGEGTCSVLELAGAAEESGRKYSSTLAAATGGSSFLDASGGGWEGAASDSEPWLQINLRDVYTIGGVVMQGRPGDIAAGRAAAFVSGFKVLASAAESGEDGFEQVGTGTFVGCSAASAQRVTNTFTTPVVARRLRIVATSHSGAAAMRAAILVAPGSCGAEAAGARVAGELNVLEAKRSYSTVMDNDAPGQGNAASALDSASHWEPAAAQQHGENADGGGGRGAHVTLDLCSQRTVSGIVTQASASMTGIDVSGYAVEYSTDGVEYAVVPGTFQATGGDALAGAEQRQRRVTNALPSPVQARYVRIKPLVWGDAGLGMRVAVVGGPIRVI